MIDAVSTDDPTRPLILSPSVTNPALLLSSTCGPRDPAIRRTTLYRCVFTWLANLVSMVLGVSGDQAMPFWLDSICVPLRPRKLKNKALEMQRPIHRAQHVLVLDSYLYTHDITNATPVEIFARVSCCSWMQRLWAFQEGRVARKLWVMFANRPLEMTRIFEKWKNGIYRIPFTMH